MIKQMIISKSERKVIFFVPMKLFMICILYISQIRIALILTLFSFVKKRFDIRLDRFANWVLRFDWDLAVNNGIGFEIGFESDPGIQIRIGFEDYQILRFGIGFEIRIFQKNEQGSISGCGISRVIFQVHVYVVQTNSV